jgi:hypothetical protein
MPHGQRRVRKETLMGGLMDLMGLIELIDSIGLIGSIGSIGSIGLIGLIGSIGLIGLIGSIGSIGSIGLTPPLIEWTQAVVCTLAVGAAHAGRCGSTWCACV